jgi:hypothetical protein
MNMLILKEEILVKNNGFKTADSSLYLRLLKPEVNGQKINL